MKSLPQVLKYEINSTSSLLINPISGAIDIVPNRILTGEITDEENVILNERGYFTGSSLSKLQERANEHSRHVPYWFYVLTTLNCNYNCPICYEKSTSKTQNLSFETLNKIINTIGKVQKEKMIPNNKMFIIMFGGEPLLGNKEVIEKALSEFSKKDWKVIFVTNGSKVTEYLDVFKKYKDTIADFRITLDGPKEIHNKRRPFRGGQDSFDIVINAINLLLEDGFTIKMQTILGNGNKNSLNDLVELLLGQGWFERDNYQWRIEGSHDYANLDPKKDEMAEGKMVQKIIELFEKYPEISEKTKFESFKYLGHIVNSFGWMGRYKTYWGPKFSFCEPQKGFHYVFSTDGNIYHCPRTINNEKYLIGDVQNGFNENLRKYKNETILTKNDCKNCTLNTLCGGGCAVQKIYYKDFDCKKNTEGIILEFLNLMNNELQILADKDKIISINETWL